MLTGKRKSNIEYAANKKGAMKNRIIMFAVFAPIISDQYVHRLLERLLLGLTFLSISGSVLDPDDDWVRRNELTKSSPLPPHCRDQK